MMHNPRWIERLRAIMYTAWGLYRKGVVSMSLSLRIAWKLAKGQTSEYAVAKQLRKRSSATR